VYSMMHKMHHGQNSRRRKRRPKLSKNVNFTKILGKFINFAEIGRKLLNFVEIWGKQNRPTSIVGLEGWTGLLRKFNIVKELCVYRKSSTLIIKSKIDNSRLPKVLFTRLKIKIILIVF